MSHFSVLVVGEDVDYQLARFHEFECTGRDDEFVKDIDITDNARSDFEKHKDDPDFATFIKSWYGYNPVPFNEEPETEGLHKYGYYTVDENGAVLKVIDRTNQDAKWDWYVEGGRWSDMLLLKSGARVNRARKQDIDFAAMAKEDDDQARKLYVECGYDPSMTWRPWAEVLKDKSFETLDARREFYRAQPGLVAFHENRKKLRAERGGDGPGRFIFCGEVDDMLGQTADEYVEAVSSKGLGFYAALKDRQWQARGEMGWFGMSSDEMDRKSWNRQLADMVAALPDDSILTVVDAHI